MKYINITLKVAIDENFSDTSKEYQAAVIREMIRQGKLSMMNRGINLNVSEVTKHDLSYDYRTKG